MFGRVDPLYGGYSFFEDGCFFLLTRSIRYAIKNQRSKHNGDHDMQVIARTTCNEFKIEYNGGKTWFVTDCHGDVWGAFLTERRARNEFNRILKSQNKVEAK